MEQSWYQDKHDEALEKIKRQKIEIILGNYCQTEFLIANAKEAYSQEGVDERLKMAVDRIISITTMKGIYPNEN